MFSVFIGFTMGHSMKSKERTKPYLTKNHKRISNYEMSFASIHYIIIKQVRVIFYQILDEDKMLNSVEPLLAPGSIAGVTKDYGKRED